MSYQPPTPRREQRQRDWIPALIGAGLTAGAAIVAALIGAATNTVNIVVGSPPTSVLTVTVTPPPAPPSTTTTTTTTTSPAPSDDDPPGGASVRRSTEGRPITLRDGFGVDLDDNLSPNWSVKNGPVGSSAGYGSDIGRLSGSGGLDLIGDYAFLSRVDGYETCAQETGYTRGNIERGSLRQGQQLCLRTNQRRYAAVTIKAITADRVEFNVVVWDPPYQ